MKKYLFLLGLLMSTLSLFALGGVGRKIVVFCPCGSLLVFGKDDRDYKQLRCLSQ